MKSNRMLYPVIVESNVPSWEPSKNNIIFSSHKWALVTTSAESTTLQNQALQEIILKLYKSFIQVKSKESREKFDQFEQQAKTNLPSVDNGTARRHTERKKQAMVEVRLVLMPQNELFQRVSPK